MLFYYFNSKKKLFYYLIDYGINYVTENYLNRLDESEPDFIERQKLAAQIKMKALNANPHILNFLGTLHVNPEVELPGELVSKLIEARKLGDFKRLNNIDMSLFRDDVAPELIFKIIQWALEGYERELINRLKGQKLTTIDYDPYWDEFYDFLTGLKKIFYKQEV